MTYIKTYELKPAELHGASPETLRALGITTEKLLTKHSDPHQLSLKYTREALADLLPGMPPRQREVRALPLLEFRRETTLGDTLYTARLCLTAPVRTRKFAYPQATHLHYDYNPELVLDENKVVVTLRNGGLTAWRATAETGEERWIPPSSAMMSGEYVASRMNEMLGRLASFSLPRGAWWSTDPLPPAPIGLPMVVDVPTSLA